MFATLRTATTLTLLGHPAQSSKLTIFLVYLYDFLNFIRSDCANVQDVAFHTLDPEKIAVQLWLWR
jgi:hypothetical protein